ncbi:hypothetical protein INR49_027917 [Caranx melampygus]|nr:hypothetical protein INR49_027917 [Caranx melampygus]
MLQKCSFKFLQPALGKKGRIISAVCGDQECLPKRQSLPNRIQTEGLAELKSICWCIVKVEIIVSETVRGQLVLPYEHLKGALEEYMVRMPKVRILRTKKREGLIRTRLLGAAAAKGEVITFLDSHCEANVNWLPPLLDRIAQNRKTIVCPLIDVIDHDNFHYETQAGDAMRGAFDWEMYYKRIPIPTELQKQDPSEPFESPVMAGGLFAVDRKWFWELGGYDTGLEIWGENSTRFPSSAEDEEDGEDRRSKSHFPNSKTWREGGFSHVIPPAPPTIPPCQILFVQAGAVG